MKNQGHIFIGCSGFSYPDWKDGAFYPAGLSGRKWLEYYAEKFRTVELNVTFYRLPQEAAFAGWLRRTPDDFRFVVKGSRYITHRLKLTECSEPLQRLMERARLLEHKLGPLLWQLAPSFKKNLDLLNYFTDLLQKHAAGPHVFEFRNPTWFEDDVFDLLRQKQMSVCMADRPADLPQPPGDLGFIYVRRHGPGEELYHGSYSDAQLSADAAAIRKWSGAGKDVWVFFNNDYDAHAPRNALTLIEKLK